MSKMTGDVFTKQFDNSKYPNETWLCQILSAISRSETNVYRNMTEHADVICLQENKVAIKAADQYEITWYISWSPCDECASQIIEFVKDRPNVKLNIFVSRLYYQDLESHRDGLRALSRQKRIGLKVMTKDDFQHCFDHFVGEGNGIQSWADLDGNSARYAAILKEITGADPRLAF
ncbi:DNA dC-_dU-editing enzyme APOBEC-3C-like isoform X1 [Acipenser ruthenus]|uniref:DNA dC->dU-editing enzyme APOBEC-3C-like isoform X1 n=1 Tax=Acipenser ruthenus TaxID=7906 RepID=UPI0027425B2B|nr:DNA dC->dU-editing enzyme APOBEC-3C-like isoform X1 [Acipenser ruthenus]